MRRATESSEPPSRAELERAVERYRPIVDEWEAFVDILARPLEPVVWANPARIDAARLETILAEEGRDPRPLAWREGAFRLGSESFGGRWWYQVGLAHAQEEASLIPVMLLDPQPGERILDLCAAPGGKTAQIALTLGLAGTVVANDVRASRLRALRGTVDRLGLANVVILHGDGCQLTEEAGWFDRVLVDAPCSDEGTLRKHPHLATTMNARLCRDLSARQKGLLRRALMLCRPGGRVVYSTCTFAPEENEEVIDTILRDGRHDVSVLPARIEGLRTAPGITSWEGRELHPDVQHALRLWPHHNDTGAFFVAVLQKGEGPREHDHPPRRLEPAPEEEWRPYASDRHGIDPAVFDDYLVFRRTKRGLHVASAALRPPWQPELHAVGLLLVKDKTTYPKLTTAGALMLGRHATRNVIDLDADQVDPFLDRLTFPLAHGQDDRCEDTGYVVVRHLGHPLGTGFWNDEDRTLRSLFPRRWSLRPGEARET